MITHGSLDASSASSPAEIRTSVMAGLSFSVVTSQGRSEILFLNSSLVWNSGFGQHLAKLLGGRRDDGDEIGLAQPALGAMAPEIAARAAMKHRRMRGRDAGLADVQPERNHAAPIVGAGVEGVTRELHGFRFKIGKQCPKVARLLLQIAIDVAERP